MSSRLLSFVAVMGFLVTSSAAWACTGAKMKSADGSSPYSSQSRGG